MTRPGESAFELATIERLERLGYVYANGYHLREDESFPVQKVVREDWLRAHLAARYPHLPGNALDYAVSKTVGNEGVTLILRNLDFHQKLTRGFEVPYKLPDGSEHTEHVYPVNWDDPDPDANDIRVVNQLPIRGLNDRRPDVLVYVNGLPLVVFELKNPHDEYTTSHGAYNQLQHYTVDVPQLFEYNALCVASDGVETRHGMWPSEWEWFAPWKSIDGRQVEKATTGSMKTLIEGLFPKDRLLDYIRHFVVFEQGEGEPVKKGAKYHQFFGVRFAVEEALRATAPEGDRKIGVVWHTQGSGKSLSMVFLVGILRRRMGNPTFVIQVDRTDLDDQLHDTFVAARQLVGEVQHAESVDGLRSLLQTEGGEVIFTTVEKFRLKEEEREHPVLSERRDLIVMADEAHRTQYGFDPKVKQRNGSLTTTFGYARYLRDALPGASFIGFTGTPIDEADRDTQAVFGNVIHTYDIPQAQADKAIVPIYYEPRLAHLRLINEDVDEDLEEIAEGEEAEKLKSKWAALEAAAGTEERLRTLAADIVTHFETRTGPGGVFGKAMVVCMSRRICVRLYDEIVALRPDWHHPDTGEGKIKVVMTGDLSKDPKAWSEAGHITTKERRDAIKERMKDPEDPLKMVIVRDMWLTGTDIPVLHTLYVDKPMRGHNIMQAIARVNRVFRDKPGGLVVDYIGVGNRLKEAAAKYRRSHFGEPTEDLETAAKGQFFDRLDQMRSLLPKGVEVASWTSLSNIDREDLTSLVLGHFVETDERRDEYLHAEKSLSSAFSLVMHLDDVRPHADEVAFYQMVRAGLVKTIPQTVEEDGDRSEAVRDLVDRSLTSEGVVDVYEAAGLEKPDISVLDDAFLEEFKSKEQENLRLRLLEKLLQDEIRLRERKNLVKYRSFREMLEATLDRYHAGAITAAEVIRVMTQVRREMEGEDERKRETGLSDEELAFYDAIVGLQEDAYDMPFLCDLVREVVEAVKRNLRVDWTKPHRENVKAGVQVAVKQVLRKRKVKPEHFTFILNRVMQQAEARYEYWPMAA